MFCLTQVLMRSKEFSSPTMILITDRTDLDTQLSQQFDKAKTFIGDMVDAYAMTESVAGGITRRIVYKGRAAKVLLDNAKLQEIEEDYKKCEEEGTDEYQIEASKKAITQMECILGTDDDRKKCQFAVKDPDSNFKIAIVVDMWIAGFDVSCLDTMYIDKPLQQHSLI